LIWILNWANSALGAGGVDIRCVLEIIRTCLSEDVSTYLNVSISVVTKFQEVAASSIQSRVNRCHPCLMLSEISSGDLESGIRRAIHVGLEEHIID